jgi:hypothetical protein
VHERGEMIQSEHFGKEQSQMLIAVVWFHSATSTPEQRDITKLSFIFTSSYLTHSSLLFQKCYAIFLERMKEFTDEDFEEEILLSDGSSQQFKNKNNFYWASVNSEERGNVVSNHTDQFNFSKM